MLLKIGKTTPRCTKQLPGDEYTGESRLPCGEYTVETQLTGGEYNGGRRLHSGEYTSIGLALILNCKTIYGSHNYKA